jgi:ankyrin repeat protein
VRARADARAPRCAGGERALLVAAKEGREDLVELLLGFKAEVDARDAVYCFSLPLSLLYVYVSCTCTLEPDHIHKGLQVEMKSGGGISKGSEGVFQTHESAGLDSHKHWKNHLVQICFKSKEKQYLHRAIHQRHI